MASNLALMLLIGLSGVLAVKVVLDYFSRKDLNAKYQALLAAKIESDGVNHAVKENNQHIKALLDKAEGKIIELQRDCEDLLGRLRRDEVAGYSQRNIPASRDEYAAPRVKARKQVSADVESGFRAGGEVRRETYERTSEEQPVVLENPQKAGRIPPELDAKTMIELKMAKMICLACSNSYFKPKGMVRQEGNLVTQEVKCGICSEELTLKASL